MPLIHDNPWLLQQLLKAAQEAAPGGNAPDPVDEKQKASDALRNLLSNLKMQMDPAGNREQFGAVADLSSNDMESMGAFVGWLAQHGTKMNGKQIVIPDQGNTARPGEDYGYYRIEPGTEIAVVADAPGGAARPTLPNRADKRYWIQTDNLKNYLTNLQGDDKLRNNVPFQWQLLKLIQDANSQFQMGIAEKYEKQVGDKQYLDSVFNPMDPANWGGDTRGTGVAVYYGDVKSTGNLADWVKKNSIRVKKDGKEFAGNDLQNFQICDVIGVLYRRSHAMTPGSDVQEAVAAYRKATEALAQQNNCDTSNWGGGGAGGGGAGTGGAGDPAILDELLAEQIFDTREIDLNKLKTFAEKYARWRANPSMNTIRDNVLRSIDSVNSQLTAPGAPIPTENIMTPLDWKGKFHNGNAGSVMATTLDNILDQVASMAYDLVNIVKRNTPQKTLFLEQQLGGPLQANHAMMRKMARLSKGA